MIRRESFFTLVSRSFWIWFGGIWLLVGVLFLIVTVWRIDAEQELQDSGVVTEGEVRDKWLETDAISPHKVRYRFTAPDGRAYEDEGTLPRKEWDALQEGDIIRVRYHPDRPFFHQLAHEKEGFALFLAIGALLTGIGGFIVGKWTVRLRRFLYLQEHGMSAEGTVLDVVPTGIVVNRERLHVVRYHYRDSVGQTHQATSRPMASVEALQWHPGDRGNVRYDRMRPTVSDWMGTRWGEA